MDECRRPESERLQGGTVVGGGGAGRWVGRTREKPLTGPQRETGGEVAGRVRLKTQDQVEAAEPGVEIRRQGRTSVQREPASGRLGVHAVQQAAVLGERGRDGIADQLDLRVGPALPQQRDRGQGDEEIAEGAASKDEQAAHRWGAGGVRSAWRRRGRP